MIERELIGIIMEGFFTGPDDTNSLVDDADKRLDVDGCSSFWSSVLLAFCALELFSTEL